MGASFPKSKYECLRLDGELGTSFPFLCEWAAVLLRVLESGRHERLRMATKAIELMTLPTTPNPTHPNPLAQAS